MIDKTDKPKKPKIGPTQAYGRPSSIEDKTNQYFVHPISDQVVVLSIKLGISPNFISLLGLACGFLAAFLYLSLPTTGFVFGGFIAMVGWHIFDGADGKLARATGQASAFGRIIDGICDHLVFGSVYIALTLHMIHTGAPYAIWWLIIGAGFSHAIQSAAYEERRQKFQRRHKGLERNVINDSLIHVEGQKSFIAVCYNFLQKIAEGPQSSLDKKLGLLQKYGDDLKRIEAINKTKEMVKLWGWLNANNRTILIAIMAFINQPILYFILETTLLNLLLIIFVTIEQRFEEKLAASIDIETAG
jgi:CDP-diacylglycerol--serine O-phosphatidyltransferase